MRKREQTNNQDNYDDIHDADNKYDEFDYDYTYEAVHYTNEENKNIYQAPPNEYFVLTDAFAENLDNKKTMSNNENIIEKYQV